MRTITNLFLLNLAVSDLLLGVLCMPFTLVGALLRDFIFGEFMCKLLPYLQACSVSVGVWTLVAISVERYYAICHPLRSLRWQTVNHAYKTIATIWSGSFICMSPIAMLSQLQPTNQGHHKCRENWPSLEFEQVYNILLDVILLVIPLLVLALTYSLITRTLWKGIRREKCFKHHDGKEVAQFYLNRSRSAINKWEYCIQEPSEGRKFRYSSAQDLSSSGSGIYRKPGKGLRRTNAEKSLINKKRVIKMLFAVVLEFFICWTPLYVVNTIALFQPSIVYSSIGYTGVSFFQLLAYTSSCCNPITYCFMNCGFRKSFLNLFQCMKKFQENGGFVLGHTSEFNLDVKSTSKNSTEHALSPLL
ncbi:hypothetical protein RI129_008129 [Pyrocoelia pectoralis]|uniref:Gastrin/cholecystokinin type B receptor n=1 Tax=Pyrocoelia pectoralis TaxID=417401 RepID=A0AAN7VIT8_9COLE